MTLTDNQKKAIAAKLEEVRSAEIAYQSYVEAVADLIELDPTKKWSFDNKTLEFVEVKENDIQIKEQNG